MTSATLEDRQLTTAVAERHPGWIVWTTKPVATRAAGNHRHRPPRGYVETIICDDWPQLDRELAEQDANDLAHPST